MILKYCPKRRCSTLIFISVPRASWFYFQLKSSLQGCFDFVRVNICYEIYLFLEELHFILKLNSRYCIFIVAVDHTRISDAVKCISSCSYLENVDKFINSIILTNRMKLNKLHMKAKVKNNHVMQHSDKLPSAREQPVQDELLPGKPVHNNCSGKTENGPVEWKRRDSFSSCSSDSAVYCSSLHTQADSVAQNISRRITRNSQIDNNNKRQRNSSGSSALSSASDTSNKEMPSSAVKNILNRLQIHADCSNSNFSELGENVSVTSKINSQSSMSCYPNAVSSESETTIVEEKTVSFTCMSYNKSPSTAETFHNLRRQIRKKTCDCCSSSHNEIVVRKFVEVTETRKRFVPKPQQRISVSPNKSPSPSKQSPKVSPKNFQSSSKAFSSECVNHTPTKTGTNRKRRSEVDKLYDALHEIKWAKHMSPDNILRQLNFRKAATVSVYSTTSKSHTTTTHETCITTKHKLPEVGSTQLRSCVLSTKPKSPPWMRKKSLFKNKVCKYELRKHPEQLNSKNNCIRTANSDVSLQITSKEAKSILTRNNEPSLIRQMSTTSIVKVPEKYDNDSKMFSVEDVKENGTSHKAVERCALKTRSLRSFREVVNCNKEAKERTVLKEEKTDVNTKPISVCSMTKDMGLVNVNDKVEPCLKVSCSERSDMSSKKIEQPISSIHMEHTQKDGNSTISIDHSGSRRRNDLEEADIRSSERLKKLEVFDLHTDHDCVDLQTFDLCYQEEEVITTEESEVDILSDSSSASLPLLTKVSPHAEHSSDDSPPVLEPCVEQRALDYETDVTPVFENELSEVEIAIPNTEQEYPHISSEDLSEKSPFQAQLQCSPCTDAADKHSNADKKINERYFVSLRYPITIKSASDAKVIRESGKHLTNKRIFKNYFQQDKNKRTVHNKKEGGLPNENAESHFENQSIVPHLSSEKEIDVQSFPGDTSLYTNINENSGSQLEVHLNHLDQVVINNHRPHVSRTGDSFGACSTEMMLSHQSVTAATCTYSSEMQISRQSIAISKVQTSDVNRTLLRSTSQEQWQVDYTSNSPNKEVNPIAVPRLGTRELLAIEDKPKQLAPEDNSLHMAFKFTIHFKGITVNKNDSYTQIIFRLTRGTNIYLSVEALNELKDTFQSAGSDSSCQVLIVNGVGSSFCAGLDLKPLLGPRKDTASKEMAVAVKDFIEALAAFSKPLVAVVNGSAVGLGVTILAYSDVIIASDAATFHMPYSQLGYSPEGAATLMLPSVVGSTVAMDLLLRGRKISAREACDYGLVSQVLQASRLPNELVSRVRVLAENPNSAMETTKTMLRMHLYHRLSLALESEVAMLPKQWLSESCQTALESAFQAGFLD